MGARVMDRANFELARTAYDAFSRKDYDAVLGMADPEVEYEFVGRFTEGNVFRGVEAIRDLWKQLDEVFLEWESRPEELIDLGDQVLVLARERGVGRVSGLEFDQKLGHLISFRDGRITRFQVFGSWRRALRELGIGPRERTGG
jgi:ketosteroid isomerase-like protein